MDDFDRYDTEQYRAACNQPQCCICNQPIFSDYLWDFMDALYCDECAEERFRRPTDKYTKEAMKE